MTKAQTTALVSQELYTFFFKQLALTVLRVANKRQTKCDIRFNKRVRSSQVNADRSGSPQGH